MEPRGPCESRVRSRHHKRLTRPTNQRRAVTRRCSASLCLEQSQACGLTLDCGGNRSWPTDITPRIASAVSAFRRSPENRSNVFQCLHVTHDSFLLTICARSQGAIPPNPSFTNIPPSPLRPPNQPRVTTSAARGGRQRFLRITFTFNLTLDESSPPLT